jgi:hypothetical protein
MKLMLESQRHQMLQNGKLPDEEKRNLKPVVKLFSPVGGATWLLSELMEDGDSAFGLCDLGLGFPELGYVSLADIESVRLPMGLYIERDLHFKAAKTLSEYADEARANRRIVA